MNNLSTLAYSTVSGGVTPFYDQNVTEGPLPIDKRAIERPGRGDSTHQNSLPPLAGDRIYLDQMIPFMSPAQRLQVTSEILKQATAMGVGLSTGNNQLMAHTNTYEDYDNVYTELFTTKPLGLALPLFGYVSPILILIILFTNTIIVIILLRRNMISPTNLLLAAMALADMLTALAPLPWFLYYYTFGNFNRPVGATWCRVHDILNLYIPTISHTVSVWLVLALAIHRYLCVSRKVIGIQEIQKTTKANLLKRASIMQPTASPQHPPPNQELCVNGGLAGQDANRKGSIQPEVKELSSNNSSEGGNNEKMRKGFFSTKTAPVALNPPLVIIVENADTQKPLKYDYDSRSIYYNLQKGLIYISSPFVAIYHICHHVYDILIPRMRLVMSSACKFFRIPSRRIYYPHSSLYSSLSRANWEALSGITYIIIAITLLALIYNLPRFFERTYLADHEYPHWKMVKTLARWLEHINQTQIHNPSNVVYKSKNSTENHNVVKIGIPIRSNGSSLNVNYKSLLETPSNEEDSDPLKPYFVVYSYLYPNVITYFDRHFQYLGQLWNVNVSILNRVLNVYDHVDYTNNSVIFQRSHHFHDNVNAMATNGVQNENEAKAKTITSTTNCAYIYRAWIMSWKTLYFNFYFWFRVLFVHLVPCTVMLVLNAVLISTLKRTRYNYGTRGSADTNYPASSTASRRRQERRQLRREGQTLIGRMGDDLHDAFDSIISMGGRFAKSGPAPGRRTPWELSQRIIRRSQQINPPEELLLKRTSRYGNEENDLHAHQDKHLGYLTTARYDPKQEGIGKPMTPYLPLRQSVSTNYDDSVHRRSRFSNFSSTTMTRLTSLNPVSSETGSVSPIHPNFDYSLRKKSSKNGCLNTFDQKEESLPEQSTMSKGKNAPNDGEISPDAESRLGDLKRTSFAIQKMGSLSKKKFSFARPTCTGKEERHSLQIPVDVSSPTIHAVPSSNNYNTSFPTPHILITYEHDTEPSPSPLHQFPQASNDIILNSRNSLTPTESFIRRGSKRPSIVGVALTSLLSSLHPYQRKSQAAESSFVMQEGGVIEETTVNLEAAHRDDSMRRPTQPSINKINRLKAWRKMKQTKQTTSMLIVVVSLTLAVEIPVGIMFIFHIISNTFQLDIFNYYAVQAISCVTDFAILASYPFNFVVYCLMSHQFRENVRSLVNRVKTRLLRACSFQRSG